jgi:hypothetical protein
MPARHPQYGPDQRVLPWYEAIDGSHQRYRTSSWTTFPETRINLETNSSNNKLRPGIWLGTLIAYAAAPKVFSPNVTKTHLRPIRWLCSAQPYLTIPWITGMIDEKARLPKVAARSGRRNGLLNRGWNVTIEHATAKADNWMGMSA